MATTLRISKNCISVVLLCTRNILVYCLIVYMTLFLNLSPSFRLHKIFQSSMERLRPDSSKRGFLCTQTRSFVWRSLRRSYQCQRNRSHKVKSRSTDLWLPRLPTPCSHSIGMRELCSHYKCLSSWGGQGGAEACNFTEVEKCFVIDVPFVFYSYWSLYWHP